MKETRFCNIQEKVEGCVLQEREDRFQSVMADIVRSGIGSKIITAMMGSALDDS